MKEVILGFMIGLLINQVILIVMLINLNAEVENLKGEIGE